MCVSHFISVSDYVIETSEMFQGNDIIGKRKKKKIKCAAEIKKKKKEAENSPAELAVKSVFFSFSVNLAPCWPSKDLQRSTLGRIIS